MAKISRFGPSAHHDDGFTIVELMAATAVIMTVMLATAGVFTSSLASVSFSKQRQTANSLLDQAMEQVRALPYQSIVNGLSNTDATASTDARITGGSSQTGTWTFTVTGEPIVHSGSPPSSEPPLIPPLATNVVNSTTYTVSAYPTMYSGASGVYRVTVYVSWADSQRQGAASSVSGQTLVYSPSSGCLSTSTHPFAAPCQPYFSAGTTTGTGQITVSAGQGWSGNPIQGIPLTQAQLLMVRNEETLTAEQSTLLAGGTYTEGASLNVTGQADQSTGTVKTTSSADNDPDTAPGASSTSSGSQSSSALTYSAGSGANSITLTPSSTDSETSTSTMSASASPACADLSNATLLSSQPCVSGNVGQSGTTASIATSLYAGSTALGSATLASVAAQPSGTATRGFLAKLPTASGGYCTSTSGDGCIHAAAQRAFGTILLAGLPSGVLGSAPSGWAGSSCNSTNALIQLSGYSDTVSSESGVSPGSPAATQSSGTLRYWNGSGCTTTTVNWGASPPSVTIPTITVSSGLGGGSQVSISATLSLGATGTATSAPSGCTTVCTASASSASPLIADITYVVTNGSTTVADLDISVNLGTLSANTSYQASPS